MIKKTLALLPVLLLAAAFAFAQDASAGKFNAWNQGNFWPYFQAGSGVATNGWSPQWDNTPGIDQEWTFSYDGKDYGFLGTLEFGMDNIGNTGPTGPNFVPPSISWFSTYYKFGDLAKITIGKPRFNDYTVFSFVDGFNFKRFGDSDFMGILQFFPVSGLSVAAAMYVPDQNVFTSATPLDYLNNFGVGASYAIPNIANVVLDYRASTSLTGAVTRKFDAGFSLTMMKDLGLIGAYEADFSNSANLVNGILLSAKYSMSSLSFALDGLVKMDPQVLAFAVDANAEYAIMGMWSAGANIGYDNGAGASLLDQGVGEFAGFVVWPYVIAHFDNGGSAKLGFVYATGATGTVDSTGAIAPNANASKQTTAVVFQYVWSF